MKKGWTLFLFWLLFIAANALDRASSPFEVSDAQGEMTELTFRLPVCDIENIHNANGDFQKISSPMAGSTETQGMPEVPVFSTFVAIPHHGSVSIDVVDSDETFLTDVRPAPYQGEESSTRGFVIDNTYYSSGNLFPAVTATISEPMVMRDYRVAQVTINPYAYDPTTGRTIRRDRVRVRVHTSIAPGVNELITDRPHSRDFEPLYRMLIANYDQTRDESGPFQARSMLVIYPENSTLTPLVNEYASWKRNKGFLVTVATTQTTGTSNTAILSYIQSTYNAENPPEYVVIIGDAASGDAIYVPTWYASGSYGEGDHPYACLVGNDLLPEVFVGRISIDSITDFQVFLGKMNIYERQVNTSYLPMFNTSLLVGDTVHSGNSTVETNLYVKERILSYDPDHTFTEMFGDNPDTGAMTQAINTGCLFFSYRGYIGMSGWSPSGLTNNNKLTNAVIITCNTGSFASGESTTEELFRAGTPAAPKGSICSIGMSTSATHTRYNNILHTGIFYGLYSEHMSTMGQAIMAGKLALYNSYASVSMGDVQSFTYWCNLMGDPSLDIWHGEPMTFAVTNSASIPNGQNWLNVNVHDANQNGISDAWVTARNDLGTVLGTGYSDGQGNVTLQFNSVPGTVNLTVTKPDYVPYLGTFTITTTGTLVVNTFPVDDDNSGASEGNGNSIINPGETIETSIIVGNLSATATSALTAVLSSDDEYVQITTGTGTFPSVNASGSSTCAAPFVFTVSPATPNLHQVEFTLTLTDSSDNTYVIPVWLTVQGVDLDVTTVSISDGENNILDPFEVANLQLIVTNHGLTPLTDVWARLETLNDLVGVTDSLAYFGNVNVNGQALCNSNPFEVSTMDQVLPGMQIPMKITFYNSDGYIEEETFSIPIGTVTVHDPLGPDSYGYVCYDNGDTGYIDCPDYEWVEINPSQGGSGTNTGLVDNADEADHITGIDLPFDFKFYGETWNHITVCTNGWIAMGVTEQATFHNWPIPGAKGPSSMVAAMWDDLRTGSGGIFTWYDQANHSFVIEWSHCSSAVNNAEETFEIILYDPAYHATSTFDGPIKIQYAVFNNVDASSTSTFQGNYCTVGLEDQTELVGLEYSYDNEYPTAAKTITNSTALYFTGAPIVYTDSYLSLGNIRTVDHNGNDLIESGETANLAIGLKNIGLSEALSNYGHLTSEDIYTTVIQDTASYPPIASNSWETNNTYFRVRVTPDCPDGHVINFVLNATNADGEWSYPFSLNVHRSTLEMTTAMVSDEAGNNDGIMDPGENIKLIINMFNNTVSPAESIAAVLTSESEFATIITSDGNYGTILPGGNMQRAFDVSIAANAPQQNAIWFRLTLTGPNQDAQVFNFPVGVGYWGFENDFEADNGEFISMTGWQWGEPSIACHSGTHCWATSLLANYGNHISWTLTTQPFFVGAGTSISFWHYFVTEQDHDGGNIRVSTSETPWELITPVDGYNAVASGDNVAIAGEPCFSGNSNGWHRVTVDLSEYAGSEVQIRWLFGSNQSTVDYGWAIDDISVTGGAERTAHIHGQITTDGPAIALSQALLTIGNYSTHPDETGQYDLFVPTGTFDFTASLNGFVSFDNPNMVCEAGANIPLNFSMTYLPPVSDLAYTVTDSNIELTWNYEQAAGRSRNAVRNTAKRTEFQHFNVWRQIGSDTFVKIDSTLTENHISVPIEELFHYRFYVTAMYDEGESAASGIVEYPLTGPVDNTDNTVPAVTRLFGNYPNPFNPETTIAFNLATPGKVGLRVYNIRGELVKTLVNETKTAGHYSVRWNGIDNNNRPVASGVYLYRLETNGTSMTRKALLLK
jgi:hypothetical protein